MNVQHFAREEEVAYRTVERDGAVEHVVDFGPDAGGATVDVVGDTAIVVVDGEQHDVSLPGDGSEAFIRNGVLTIRTEDSA